MVGLEELLMHLNELVAYNKSMGVGSVEIQAGGSAGVVIRQSIKN